VARQYWEAFGKVMPEHLDFQGRMTSSHQNNASDPVNLALNYGYGFLEGECLRAINAVGLEPAIGFLHDVSNYQTKQSLVYDIQEPFRWLIDLTVIQAFESGTLDLPDFYFTGDDYRFRFEAEAKKRFIDMIRERINSGVQYKGRVLKWDTVIEDKANELGRVLVSKSPVVDFTEPEPELLRYDRKLKDRILTLTSTEASELGIGKSTLYHLRSKARRQEPFRLYRAIAAKLAGV